ncbi:hypothetical protein GCM10007147_43150 [Nocardiopsis kunsanensis]|uniref:MinD-like ATPase involved in chromosome partitioning or flagellar assembly n=1 Tax=Nocardiopsis kunsanensis TaxID=141693 RepID=A0A918XLQ8_9ACTN|nr:TcpE family conjugal transfer membrane protein [Nocardiopsis kunsanensis]GHD36080.1 hypothetical protein GCM10007147_43150 [Nocardiopsis kunsanensis]
MDLPTYTNIWRIEKRLYKLYDFRLPMPLPVGTFGVAMGIFLIWVVLLSVLNAPFDFGNGWHLVLWVVPPGVITVLATRPVIEGKRLTELLISQARFFTEPRVMTRLAPEYEPGEARVSARVWHRSANAGSLPLPRRHHAETEHGTEGTHGAQETEEAEAATPDPPPLWGVAGPAKAEPVRAEPIEELYTPAEPAGARGSTSAADGTGPREPSGPGDRDEQDPGTRPGPEGPREPARPRARERVPVFAAAAPAHGTAHDEPSAAAGTAPSAAMHDEEEAGPHPSSHADAAPGPGRARRSVGRKVLNYFGFALEPGTEEPSAGDGGHGRGDGTGDAGPLGRSEETGTEGEYGGDGDEGLDGFEEPVFVTEEDEDRDRDAWVASLRASSGHTPVRLTSKAAYTGSDTGPMSSGELAEATRDGGRQETGTGQESAPARRLRGRTQSIRVTRELDEHRSGAERLEVSEAPEQAPERSGAPGSSTDRERTRGAGGDRAGERASGTAAEHAPERASEPAPERRRARGRGQALPAEAAPSEESGTGASGDTGQPERPKRRPHAAPWELDRERERGTPAKEHEGPQARRDQQDQQGTGGNVERSDLSDLSDYAAQYAAATGRPTVDTPRTPWLPPASGAPDEEGAGQSPAPRGEGSDRTLGDTGDARGAEHTGNAEHTDPDTHTERTARTTGVRTGTEDRGDASADRTHSAEDEQHVSREASGAQQDRAEDRAPQAGPASDRETAPDRESGTDRSAGPDREPAPAGGGAGAALELDHGTGEHDAMPFRRHEDPDAHGPEWNEHMSVLDRHLSKADTPPPPRPRFADAVPDNERGPEQSGSAWFDDGGHNDPDRPRSGDRGNPVISARELRARDRRGQGTEGAAGTDGTGGVEDSGRDARAADTADTADTAEAAEAADAAGNTEGKATAVDPDGSTGDEDSRSTDRPGPTGTAASADGPAAADDPAAAGPRPPIQLDHGTGELASFSDVRGDRADPAPSAEPETPRRRTADELARAEARALEERRRRAASARPGAGQGAGILQGPRGEDETPASEAPRPSTEAGSATEDRAAAGERSSAVPEGARAADHRPDDASRAENRDVSAAHPRANPSLAALARDRPATEDGDSDRTGATGTSIPDHGGREHESADPADRTGGTAGEAGPAEDPHEGVFHRVAQNARRLGLLFGHPSPDEDPDSPEREARPELELDHGTGEQERLGDTPNGVPAQRSDRTDRSEPRPESGGTRGWRRLARVVTGGNASTVRSDLPDSDIERLRTPLPGPRNLVVLGCTGGAGQTVTGLMIGHTLAAHRDDRVVAVDVNPGPNGLSRRVGVQTPETLTALLANADGVRDYEQMRSYVSRAPTGLEIVQTLDDPYVQTLDDRDYGQIAGLLGGFYGVTLMDPAATGVSRALPGADGLVLVAPASADAERAVSMTFEWLDGNGYSSLRANSVLVVNGVSKRSLPDVDAAERVARGRCRAIVRIPWDDHLGASYTRIDVGALRSATKRAHGALGGVLVRSLTD